MVKTTLRLPRKNERVGHFIASKRCSSDDAVSLSSWASRVLLVSGYIDGGLRYDAVSMAAWSSWIFLVGGDVDGDGG